MNTKKCPFCAHDKTGFKTVFAGGRHEHRVVCLNCNALGPNELNADLAVASWNERREVHPSVQVDADACDARRSATPEQLLKAMIWFLLQGADTPTHGAEDAIYFLRAGFQLAQPGGWERVAPMWLRESRKERREADESLAD